MCGRIQIHWFFVAMPAPRMHKHSRTLGAEEAGSQTKIAYDGSETCIAEQVTADQTQAGLPPTGLAASVDILPLVDEPMRRALLDPELDHCKAAQGPGLSVRYDLLLLDELCEATQGPGLFVRCHFLPGDPYEAAQGQASHMGIKGLDCAPILSAIVENNTLLVAQMKESNLRVFVQSIVKYGT